MSNSFIWPIGRTLSGATILGYSGFGSNSNKEVLYIPQIFSITGASPSDCLMLDPGHSKSWVVLSVQQSKYWSPSWLVAQSAGAVEYTDCTSAEG